MITLKHRRATAAILSAANPTLAAGEFAVESDTGRIKIGNGSTAWVSLGYAFPLESTLATYAALALADGQPAATLDVYPRGESSSVSINTTSGSVFFIFFTPMVTITVSSITIASGAATAASGLTLARMGLYTFNESTATLVARTASDTTLFTALSTAYQRSFSTVGGFPATYTLNAGARYGVGVLSVGTTAPQIAGRATGPGIAGLTPRMNAVLASQTDLATASGLGTGQGHIFARLS